MSEVQVGQVWQDKDKRRDTRIEIIAVPSQLQGDAEVTGLVVGTEETRTYQIDRLVKRWKLIEEKATEVFTEIHSGEPVEIEVEITTRPDGSGSVREVKRDAPPKFKTREQWLEAAVKELSKIFVKAGFEVPQVRVSVGWPGGRGKKAGVVGQCFASTSTADKVAQIFVTPTVSDSLSVLATMAHELVHAVDDCQDGHKKNFIRIAKAIGFVPAWTSSENRSDELTEKLQKIVDRLGTFPHAVIRPEERPVVQRTYMRKVVSRENPDFFVRMTVGKIEEFGLPTDPWGFEMELEDN